MNEIKLRPGEEFVYNGIRFICLDIIGGNANSVRTVSPSGAVSGNCADSSYGLAPVCLFNSDNLTLRRQAQLISAE